MVCIFWRFSQLVGWDSMVPWHYLERLIFIFHEIKYPKPFHWFAIIIVIDIFWYSLGFLRTHLSILACFHKTTASQKCVRGGTCINLFSLSFAGVYAFGFLFMLPQLFVNYKVSDNITKNVCKSSILAEYW